MKTQRRNSVFLRQSKKKLNQCQRRNLPVTGKSPPRHSLKHSDHCSATAATATEAGRRQNGTSEDAPDRCDTSLCTAQTALRTKGALIMFTLCDAAKYKTGEDPMSNAKPKRGPRESARGNDIPNEVKAIEAAEAIPALAPETATAAIALETAAAETIAE